MCLFALGLLGQVRGQVEVNDDQTESKAVSKATKDGSDKSAQYNKQAPSIFTQDEGLPAFGVLDGNELVKFIRSYSDIK